MFIRSMVLAAAVFAGGVPMPAGAEPVEVGAGQAQLLRLDRPAARVIVGDPSVADVSVDSPRRITVFGKRVGATTLIVLDAAGTAVMSEPVVVHTGGAGAVTVTYGAGKDVPPGGAWVVHVCGSGCSRAEAAKPGQASGGARQ